MCGIVGILGSPNASAEAYQALLLLQHRGQDSAGILSYDFSGKSYSLHKNLGYVDKVFNQQNIQELPGECAIGHTRYSTVGKIQERDIQPLMINYPYGMGLVHNGNLVNFFEMVDYLKIEKHRYLFTQNDAEVILNLMADKLASKSRVIDSQGNYPDYPLRFTPSQLEESVKEVFNNAKGGYSVIGSIANHGMFAFRDPHGIRPLIIGRRELSEKEQRQSHYTNKYSYCLSSESNVLEFLGYERLRDLAAGELVFIDKSGEVFSKQILSEKKASCMFEWVYFSNPESTLENINVYGARLALGQKLGEMANKAIADNQICPDIIVPVPETSRVAAIALSETVNKPFREILIKNRYVQRSFIMNTQEKRDNAVQLKLSPVMEQFKGKRVLLVDDSIVRGTTSKQIIKMLRKAEVKEITFASTCPPILHPCYYGIDFPDPRDLVAYDRSQKEIEKHLGADKVLYLSIDELKSAIGTKDLCTGCLDGKYPVDNQGAKEILRKREDLGVNNVELN